MRGLNSLLEQLYPEQRTNWICPGPRASGLRQKRHCSVPSLYVGRHKKKTALSGFANTDRQVILNNFSGYQNE
jgi:hypothetical protein